MIRNHYGKLFHFCTSNLWKSFTLQDSKSFTGIIWPLQKKVSQRLPWNGFAMWFWMSYSGKGASNSFLRWVTPWPQGFLGVQFDGTNWWHSFHNLSFWVQNHVHQFWLNDFVGRRQMANHDIRRLKYLKIISEYFRMNWNDLAWTVLWTSGKWLPISFCKHDFKAMMVLLKWFVGRGQVRDQNDLMWWQV